MLTRTRIFIIIFLLTGFVSRLQAQSIDYLRHNKTFYLCDYKLDCAGCYDCQMSKFTVKIKNLSEKKIKGVSYVYYSRTFNKVMTKHATMVSTLIDPKQVGVMYMCLPNGKHWAISEIEYDDDSKVSFVVKDRLMDFVQEADECDCNPRTNLPNLNVR